MSGLKNLRFGRWAILLVLGLFLLGYNASIIQKERLLRSADSVILALRPIDPRSLMQGDYMILEFELERDIKSALPDRRVEHGLAVLTEVDGEHKFTRIYDGALGQEERLLEFRASQRGYKVSSGSFFFEEGLEPLYSQARYAELKADEGGKSIIYALLDKNKERLSKKRLENSK